MIFLGGKNDHEFFWSKMVINFFWSKMSINEPKMFINFFWVRYAMRKMSINNPLSGVGLAHENLT